VLRSSRALDLRGFGGPAPQDIALERGGPTSARVIVAACREGSAWIAIRGAFQTVRCGDDRLGRSRSRIV
jgi:hypothetical protein